MNLAIFEDTEIVAIVVGVVFGIVCRIITLRTDYRQYPTYPHGKVIHVSLGVIAAGLGAVAVPALLKKDYTAITFLALAAQQFREVRNMERETLGQVDKMELVPRGNTYIEGIAMVFEGRNYMVIFASFTATLFSLMFQWYWGVAAGIISLVVAKAFQSGKALGQIADIRVAEIRFEGADLFVDSIHIMNVGLESDRRVIAEHGLGLIVVPKNENVKVTIANIGQRQAILHNVSVILGIYRDSGEPALVPMAKLDLHSGTLAVFALPREKDPAKAIAVLRNVPVLENAVRMPTESPIGEGKG